MQSLKKLCKELSKLGDFHGNVVQNLFYRTRLKFSSIISHEVTQH